ncbi:MAG TPA: hypothetical protein VIA62_02260 [Thermoanaerobaculia bacterium]|jgi:hypothetical protein|nr:hypothetical protein [Thermoanaerobaculia bacterium]
MRVTTGRVVNGRIEVPGEDFTEGMVVTILTPEDRETFTLGPEAEASLLAAIEEADRGELLSEEEFWRELRRD